ncbi:hypothetical protein GC163_10275 [bacterium]|nr:hypothetical protein [bacterium]
MLRIRRIPLWTTTLLLLGLAIVAQRLISPGVTTAALQADGQLKWYRGNMHTHSYWSDGDNYLENIALWYREHNYDFLVFTDHNTLAASERWIDVDKVKSGRVAYGKLKANFPDSVTEREHDGKTEVRLKTFAEVSELVGLPSEYLLIQGEEVTDKFGRSPIHMNVSNVREVIPPLGGSSVTEVMQNNVNAAIAQRERTGQPMIIHLNHPNFGFGVTAEDLLPVVGENFFEVYNGHPGVYNSGDTQHASTERFWDILLTRRLAELNLPVLYGLATDDGHSYHSIPSRASEPGRGWVMVLSESLKPDALIHALEAGRFYASSGVTLSRVESGPRGLSIEVAEEPGVTYRTEFIGTRTGYDATSTPVLNKDGEEMHATRQYSDDIGTVLSTQEGTTARYEFRGDEIYVRARVISSKLHPNPSEIGEFERAWVQPLVGPVAR